MPSDVVISSVRLAAASAVMAALDDFYRGCLGFSGRSDPSGHLRLTIGGAQLEFAPAPGDARPFYHVALLVPGNRFAAARAWVERCAGLLSRPGQTATTLRFDDWDADACYFHDPAGNIVELIAHGGIGESAAGDVPFIAGELLGISELGLVVTDPPTAARTLAAAGLVLWSGGVDGDDALAFVGRQAHTLILCAPGRPWLPTQRPAERHPVSASVGLGGETVGVTVTAGVLTAGVLTAGS